MSKKPDPIDSPKRRLARAKQHIRRLEKRIQTFFKGKPGGPITEVDPDGSTIHAFNLLAKSPIVGLMPPSKRSRPFVLPSTNASAAVLGGVAEPKNAYFPFADTAIDLDAITKGRCKDLRPEISTLFRSFDSHQGGNCALWALNKLCNANKHRLLIPVGITSGGMGINHMVASVGVSIPAPVYDRAKHQIVTARVSPDATLQYDMQLSFIVAFDDFNGVEGDPAVGILDAIASEVNRVLRAAEAECKRIGLIT
jgi:hypothetical protein